MSEQSKQRNVFLENVFLAIFMGVGFFVLIYVLSENLPMAVVSAAVAAVAGYALGKGIDRITANQRETVLADRERALALLASAPVAPDEDAAGGVPPAGAKAATSSYFDRLVTINVDNLAAYYALVKVHANNSFGASLGAGVVGLLLIVVGLVLSYNTDRQPVAYIAAGAGVLTEFISAVFFYLYSKTVRQLKEYHDSLLDVQNVLLAFRIVDETTDEATRSAMATQMLGYLVTRQSGAAPPQPR